MRVVVADDSDRYREALCDILRQVPEVEVSAIAQDGVEALDLVQTVKPDALLLDIEMPRMNGWEVLEQLQDTDPAPRVLVISSHAAASVRQLALQHGAYAYINKGDAQQIIDMIYGLASAEVRARPKEKRAIALPIH
jgi:DNA-binding NarL/FixJ family response regulator